MFTRTILHSDVNNFFASVETVSRPELMFQPVAVTGNPEKRTGIILAKNNLAKSFGVTTGMTIYEAKKLCPDLVCLEPHYSKYEEISQKLHEIYLSYTDLVEPLGLDECWLDVTGSLKLLNKTGEQIANEIREKVKQNFGFTVSVGVSFSKIYAKLGSDLKKPDAVTSIPKDKFKEIAYPLPLNSIIGIGRRLERKFTLMNVTTIGDFCNLDEKFVKSIMGINGVKLLRELKGDESDPVKNYFELSPPKSIGNGTTTIRDIYRRDEIEKVLAFLAEKVSKRLIEGKFVSSTISVSLKDSDLSVQHKSVTFPPTYASSVILRNAMTIVDSFFNYDKPIRAVRLTCSNLTKIDKFKQLSLFDEKQERSSIGIEKIVAKYGADSIFRASESENFINRKNHKEMKNEE